MLKRNGVCESAIQLRFTEPRARAPRCLAGAARLVRLVTLRLFTMQFVKDAVTEQYQALKGLLRNPRLVRKKIRFLLSLRNLLPPLPAFRHVAMNRR